MMIFDYKLLRYLAFPEWFRLQIRRVNEETDDPAQELTEYKVLQKAYQGESDGEPQSVSKGFMTQIKRDLNKLPFSRIEPLLIALELKDSELRHYKGEFLKVKLDPSLYENVKSTGQGSSIARMKRDSDQLNLLHCIYYSDHLRKQIEAQHAKNMEVIKSNSEPLYEMKRFLGSIDDLEFYEISVKSIVQPESSLKRAVIIVSHIGFSTQDEQTLRSLKFLQGIFKTGDNYKKKLKLAIIETEKSISRLKQYRFSIPEIPKQLDVYKETFPEIQRLSTAKPKNAKKSITSLVDRPLTDWVENNIRGATLISIKNSKVEGIGYASLLSLALLRKIFNNLYCDINRPMFRNIAQKEDKSLVESMAESNFVFKSEAQVSKLMSIIAEYYLAHYGNHEFGHKILDELKMLENNALEWNSNYHDPIDVKKAFLMHWGVTADDPAMSLHFDNMLIDLMEKTTPNFDIYEHEQTPTEDLISPKLNHFGNSAPCIDEVKKNRLDYQKTYHYFCSVKTSLRNNELICLFLTGLSLSGFYKRYFEEKVFQDLLNKLKIYPTDHAKEKIIDQHSSNQNIYMDNQFEEQKKVNLNIDDIEVGNTDLPETPEDYVALFIKNYSDYIDWPSYSGLVQEDLSCTTGALCNIGFYLEGDLDKNLINRIKDISILMRVS